MCGILVSVPDNPTRLRWIPGKRYFLKGPKGNFKLKITSSSFKQKVSTIAIDIDSQTVSHIGWKTQPEELAAILVKLYS